MRPGMLRAWVTTSALSANWGMTLTGTKEVTCISVTPEAASALIHAFLASVGKNVWTIWSPSRGPTSLIVTSVCISGDSLPPLEIRLALLVKSSHSLEPVLRLNHPVVCFDLEGVAGLEISLCCHPNRFLSLAHSNGRVGGNLASRPHCVVNQRLIVAELIDDSPFISLLGGEWFAGKDDFFGSPHAAGPGQILGSTGAGHDPEPGFGLCKSRRSSSIDKVRR